MSERDSSPIAALEQAERVLAQRLMFLAEALKTIDATAMIGSAAWAEYAAVAAALANVMGQTRGWLRTRAPGRPRWTGPGT